LITHGDAAHHVATNRTRNVRRPFMPARVHVPHAEPVSAFADVVPAVPVGPVLHIAAGTGGLTLALLEAGCVVTAVDASTDRLAWLAHRLVRVPVDLRTRCTVVLADPTGFRLPDRYPTAVVAADELSHVDDDARTALYRCVAEHLAPGGRFLLAAPGTAEPVRWLDPR
jgi:SAM-dependent methyltransferase